MSPIQYLLFFGLALVVLATALPAQTNEELRKDALEFFGPPLATRTPTPDDNPFSEAKAELGRQLFADPRLSGDGRTTCVACHDPANGGAGNTPAVVGHGWQREPRNAPTVYNAGLNAVVPIDAPAGDRTAPKVVRIRGGIDIDGLPPPIVERLRKDEALGRQFASAFPAASPAVSAMTIGWALEAYLSTLVTPAPFDRFLAGDVEAIGTIEKLGLASFIDKGCVACHAGSALGGAAYEAYGVGASAPDKTLYRVAPLRNVGRTPPYFHAGTVDRLEDAVAVMLEKQTAEKSLDGDIAAIAAFLRTLNGTPVKP
jgi:cytochrome c peroxidase